MDRLARNLDDLRRLVQMLTTLPQGRIPGVWSQQNVYIVVICKYFKTFRFLIKFQGRIFFPEEMIRLGQALDTLQHLANNMIVLKRIENMKIINDSTLADIFIDIVDELKNIFHDKLHKVFLYGSYARGEAGPESDLDVFVLLNVPDVDSREYQLKLAEAEVDIAIKYKIVSSIIPEISDEFYDNINVIPLFKNINREGVLLYEA
jgi:predicted nucleotidyltransferase